jgi:hypothetical protein
LNPALLGKCSNTESHPQLCFILKPSHKIAQTGFRSWNCRRVPMPKFVDMVAGSSNSILLWSVVMLASY